MNKVEKLVKAMQEDDCSDHEIVEALCDGEDEHNKLMGADNDS